MEVEIRTQIDDPRPFEERIADLGFVFDGEIKQLDIILDRPDAALFRSGQKIRIRKENKSAELTYKGKTSGDHTASRREELNLELAPEKVADCIELFSSIGFPVCFQIEKTRRSFHKGELKVTFDSWPLIGNILEIEDPENAAKKLAAKIAPELEFRNYRLKDILKKLEQKTGKTIAELKREHKEKTGFDLGKIELLLED